jgi:hypothetical protein
MVTRLKGDGKRVFPKFTQDADTPHLEVGRILKRSRAMWFSGPQGDFEHQINLPAIEASSVPEISTTRSHSTTSLPQGRRFYHDESLTHLAEDSISIPTAESAQ